VENFETADWKAIFDQYGSKILLFARQFVPNQADAEDSSRMLPDGIGNPTIMRTKIRYHCFLVVLDGLLWTKLGKTKGEEKERCW
jgi:hypothetical protein